MWWIFLTSKRKINHEEVLFRPFCHFKYRSMLLAGRRSSKYPFPSFSVCLGSDGTPAVHTRRKLIHTWCFMQTSHSPFITRTIHIHMFSVLFGQLFNSIINFINTTIFTHAKTWVVCVASSSIPVTTRGFGSNVTTTPCFSHTLCMM